MCSKFWVHGLIWTAISVVVAVPLAVVLALSLMDLREQDMQQIEVDLTDLAVPGLINGDFEGAWTRDTFYWTPQGGPYSNPFGEIFTPSGWVTWWMQDFPCATGYTFQEGRPEVQVIDLETGFPDQSRIHSGHKAMKMFTFWRCHEMGLLQQIETTPGKVYRLTAYGQAWHSNCSSRPHDPPLAEDCETPLPDSWDHLRVGIDPYGGLDPHGATVVWGQAIEQYGSYDQAMQVNATAEMSLVTVFLSSECNYPLKHDDVYWDSVSFEQVDQIFLPLVLKE
jgi:hypothetical protein